MDLVLVDEFVFFCWLEERRRFPGGEYFIIWFYCYSLLLIATKKAPPGLGGLFDGGLGINECCTIGQDW